MKKMIFVTLLILIFVSQVNLTVVSAAAKNTPPKITPPKLEAVKSIDLSYPLPVSGMLPDNPLYFFKLARDKVLEILIFDRTQKKFYLLYLSDKRLTAGIDLINKNDSKLAILTWQKSQEIFENIVSKIENSPANYSPELKIKLSVALLKRDEIFTKFLSTTPTVYQSPMNLLLSGNQNLINRTKNFNNN